MATEAEATPNKRWNVALHDTNNLIHSSALRLEQIAAAEQEIPELEKLLSGDEEELSLASKL